jgi:hypothetical protein
MRRRLILRRAGRKKERLTTRAGSIAMTMCKSLVLGLAATASICTAGAALADSNKDAQAAQREAYVKSAGQKVTGVPESARITSVDPLGDHRVAFYTVDGSHKDVWLVTTDAACDQPVLADDHIVSLESGIARECQSVAIQSVDKRELGSRLHSLPRDRWVSPADANLHATDLRYETAFRTEAMTDSGRTR